MEPMVLLGLGFSSWVLTSCFFILSLAFPNGFSTSSIVTCRTFVRYFLIFLGSKGTPHYATPPKEIAGPKKLELMGPGGT